MVLNMLTTVAMIKWGKTYGNLMVDVRTGSEKLKDRAKRILGIVTGLEPDAAEALLKRAKWNVKAAIVMEKAGLTLPQAAKRLRKADNSLRDPIGEDIEPRFRAWLEIQARGCLTNRTRPLPRGIAGGVRRTRAPGRE